MSSSIGTLYVVATPIGNLDDITHRAVSVLSDVDRIVCEDTRVTKKLLFYYKITRPLVSYGPKDVGRKEKDIIEHLEDGENIALVTDAGTPAIADPGGGLVAEVAGHFGGRARIIPIPGPSALTAALSVAGVPANRFFFAGYPPHKKKRTAFFTTLAEMTETIVLYESKHRIVKTLTALAEHIAGDREVAILREGTKVHEEVLYTTIEGLSEVTATLETRGEFVIVIRKS